MRILYVSSECAPFSKSGGLADVAYSLPIALKEAGNETAVITPLYRCARLGWFEQMEHIVDRPVRVGDRECVFALFKGESKGVRIWFLACDELYDRPRLYGYGDDAVRFAFFSRAVLEFLDLMEFEPQIIHCNDWESALTVVYLKDMQYSRKELRRIKTVFTIHNIAYQGQFGRDMLWTLGLDSGWYDGGMAYEYQGRHDINLMKCAMMMADAVSTVSPNYARELHSARYGHGLEGVIDMVDSRLWGILNGIDMDLYDPSLDEDLPARFDTENMAGKKECKRFVQKAFGINEEDGWPLIAAVARLVEQKGLELIRQVMPGLMDIGVQLVVFGQGDRVYEDYFRWAREDWPGQVGFSSDYTEAMARKVFAGGLKDSVRLYSDFDGQGDGFGFQEYHAKYLYLAVLEAVKLYLGDEKTFALMRRRCMEKDLSWAKSAAKYERMYGEICEDRCDEHIVFEDGMNALAEKYRMITESNRRLHPEIYRPGYRRALQIRMTGRCDGVFSLRFSGDSMEVIPRTVEDCDAQVECSYDNLMAMAEGTKDPDKLFMNGQLKVTGSMIKGHEFRDLLKVRE